MYQRLFFCAAAIAASSVVTMKPSFSRVRG